MTKNVKKILNNELVEILTKLKIVIKFEFLIL